VAVVQGQLFTRLRPYYERRDALKLKIQFYQLSRERPDFLETLPQTQDS